ncbi:RNA polymerase ECF family sigma subunit [Halopolyspora algeriensis]|uniref:RNA polymerase ECF family sigma subunit n=1 Tax=Halopolyspora algeriensis TaxID=1500506 RepID=A0A368VMH1_9ACTN|nr:sigma-70 family RNA polymerase sigma factor [Halopolyspora algeriensis]RCW40220.1 RNA polymerase ECF family sigma subunit [Halopolyspora algeriensis]TQM46299.1 RNA polymerase ECF family sigma subunit [Halopolyspora algeriensis]
MGDGQTRFGHIYRRHYGDIRRFVGRRVAEGDVDDVTAEVFVVVWRRLSESPAGDRLLPWLYGIARRVLSNEFRRVRRAHALAEHVAAQPAEPAGTDHAAAVADRLAMAAAFDRLREDDREVLRLVAWENLTSAEVATVLGCARTTAAMRINRARRRLLDALRRGASRELRGGSAVAAAEGAKR